MRRGDGKQAWLGAHRVFEGGRWRSASLYERGLLKAGDRVTGPAVIVELSATTYLPMHWRAEVDGFGNLRLTAERKSGRRA